MSLSNRKPKARNRMLIVIDFSGIIPSLRHWDLPHPKNKTDGSFVSFRRECASGEQPEISNLVRPSSTTGCVARLGGDWLRDL